MQYQQQLKNLISITESQGSALLENWIDICDVHKFEQLCLLQDRLAESIFETRHTSVKFTDKGKQLIALTQVFLQHLPALNMAEKSFEERKITQLRIGMPTDYISLYLNSLLFKFIRLFTPLELIVDTDVSGNLFKRLHQNTFDLILATHWQQPQTGIELCQRRFHWAAAKHSALLQPSRLPPSPLQPALAEQTNATQTPLPIALYPENCPIRVQVFANHRLDQMPLNIVLSTPSPQALCEVVEQDLAVATIAEFRISEKMQILEPKQYGLPELPLFYEAIYYPEHSQLTAEKQLLQDLLLAYSRFIHSFMIDR